MIRTNSIKKFIVILSGCLIFVHFFISYIQSDIAISDEVLPLGNICHKTPPNLIGWLEVSLRDEHPDDPILYDGPADYIPPCENAQKIAIIIPVYQRDIHLKILLHHLHPILQRQQADYTIFVVESLLAENQLYNKAVTFNAAVLELENKTQGRPFNCYILHDVDLLPENDNILYRCYNRPIHMSLYIDKYDYKDGYGGTVGGVLAIRPDQYRLVNGYSNLFAGWGGEDDDLSHRLLNARLETRHLTDEFARWTMLPHDHPKHFTQSPDVNNVPLLKGGLGRRPYDGLNTAEYSIVSIKKLQRTVKMVVSYNQTKLFQNYKNRKRTHGTLFDKLQIT